ncbi:MAG: NnrS family protein [Myxococcota bacterium]|nr:NnrS family protein [Myxococcota bacterium]
MTAADTSGGRGASALLDAGFRPFFLLGSLYAVTAMAAWLSVYLGASVRAWDPWPGPTWHGHEMIFGFVATAIAGFLLTAVPTWTDSERIRGRPLALLVGIWLLGRLALWLPSWLPGGVVALVDLAFLPLLALVVGRPIWRSGRRRNYPVVAVLGLLSLANLGLHAAVLTGDAGAARFHLHLAFYLVLALLAIISGRIVPLFTRNALRRRGVEAAVVTSPAVERLLPFAMGAAVGLALLREGSTASGMASLFCAVLLGLRQRRWQPLRTLDQPILWVLHVGHAWLALGFAFTGVAALAPVFPASTALHALGAGAIGTSIVGVMSRVALGHTGRALEAPRAVVVAYALVIAGGLVRVVGPLAAPGAYRATVLASGLLWATGYLLFVVRYGGILTRPRRPEPT